MVLIAGGENNSGALSTAELYNPTNGTFALTGSMHYTHIGNTAMLLNNGMVLIAGGNASSAELYNPTTGTFTATGSLNTTRYYHTATLTPPGLISISVSPANPWVPLGGFENLADIGTFTGDVTETLGSANWTSTNAPVVTVTNDWSNYGHAIAVSDGNATVTVCAGSVCGSR